MREAQTRKIPYSLVLGDNEKEKRTVTYRKYQSEEKVEVSIDEFVKLIKEEIKNKVVR